MNEKSLEIIGLELAILHRRLASITTYKRIGNLERSEYLLLEQITSHGCAGVKTLAEEFHLNISTVSRQAHSLESKGFVYRIPDKSDKRAYALQVTELGKKELREYKRVRLAKMAELLKEWPEEDGERFGQLLQKLNRTFLDE